MDFIDHNPDHARVAVPVRQRGKDADLRDDDKSTTEVTSESAKRSVRINYALDGDAYDQLLTLSDEIRSSVPKMVRRALEVYVMLWNYIHKGYNVMLTHPNGDSYRIPADLLK
jgi:hypothetical protein